ncbi:hypothetical protein OG455_19595 [Kitasatospora sp. NBC_01287]|uniref:hypothetical protein n=1 Tax=Kitasatospora sp. NBC_01287 TaxID=2903573 RepID=UPI0022547AD5|nr:hypothetical protein [Kitasatospora sp. NBC_01287]MCX4747691.1 hypothetical protein [Kitasatospora sp. NBC_01287]
MMNDEAVLLESRTLRANLAQRTDALDKVKALLLLPDGAHVTARLMADYFEVGERAINAVVHRHRDELRGNGYTVLKGAELQDFLSCTMQLRRTPGTGLGVFPRRAVLNVAMLLRDSEVARAVRRHLLDAAEQPGDLSGVTIGQLVEQATRVVQQRVAELQQGVAALEARHAVLSAQVRRDQELLAALTVRLADTAGAVHTLGGRGEMLCTLGVAPGQGRRRRR